MTLPCSMWDLRSGIKSMPPCIGSTGLPRKSQDSLNCHLLIMISLTFPVLPVLQVQGKDACLGSLKLILTTWLEKSRTLKLIAKILWVTWVLGSSFRLSFPWPHTDLRGADGGFIHYGEWEGNYFKTWVLGKVVLSRSWLPTPTSSLFFLKYCW